MLGFLRSWWRLCGPTTFTVGKVVAVGEITVRTPVTGPLGLITDGPTGGLPSLTEDFRLCSTSSTTIFVPPVFNLFRVYAVVRSSLRWRRWDSGSWDRDWSSRCALGFADMVADRVSLGDASRVSFDIGVPGSYFSRADFDEGGPGYFSFFFVYIITFGEGGRDFFFGDA